MCDGDAGAGRDQAEHAVVGHDQRGRAAGQRPSAIAASKRASTVVVVLAAGRRRELAPPPRRAHARPARVDLVGRSSPSQSPPLRSRRPGCGVQPAPSAAGDDLGGLAGPAEVGAVHDRRARSPTRPSASARSRAWLLAERGERRVEPALPAVLEVPFRLAVADDQEVVHGWSVKQSAAAGLTLCPARRQT